LGNDILAFGHHSNSTRIATTSATRVASRGIMAPRKCNLRGSATDQSRCRQIV